MKGFRTVKSDMHMRSARTHAGGGLPLEGAGLLGRREGAGRVPGQWGGD